MSSSEHETAKYLTNLAIVARKDVKYWNRNICNDGLTLKLRASILHLISSQTKFFSFKLERAKLSAFKCYSNLHYIVHREAHKTIKYYILT